MGLAKKNLGRIHKVLAHYRQLLMLQQWNIELRSMSEPYENNPEAAATNSVLEPYMNSLIRVYPKFWDLPEAEQDEVICHELCHCLTQQFWDLAATRFTTSDEVRNSLERLTTWITKITTNTGGYMKKAVKAQPKKASKTTKKSKKATK